MLHGANLKFRIKLQIQVGTLAGCSNISTRGLKRAGKGYQNSRILISIQGLINTLGEKILICIQKKLNQIAGPNKRALGGKFADLISGYVFSYITKIRVGIQSQVTFLSSDNNYSNCNCGGNHLNRTVKD